MDGRSAHTSARIAFRVLGPLEVDGPDGRPIDVCGGKPAAVMTLLLLHRNAWVSTDQLIEAVWAGRDTPASAPRNLKTYVWQLRRALPDERIESRPGAYRVSVLPGELDADVAAGLSDEARELLASGAAADAAKHVERALGLWRGCPYESLTGDASSAVERLTELHRSLREYLADAQLALGQGADGLALLRALTDEEPLREHAWTKLMAALWQTGRRHEALAAYQRARTALVRELGIEPGAELTLLHQDILNEELPVAAARPAASELTGRSDLPGRIAGFSGRAEELAIVRSVADEVARVALLTIDGMPGVGKTALALEAAAELSGPDRKLYLDLRTCGDRPLSATDALGKLLRAIRGTGVSLPEARDELASIWRSLDQRILLVLDDVADAAQVRDLLPNTPGSVVLVTSRMRLTGLDRTGAISLDVLPAADARQLTGSDEILRCCAGHPGAIRHLTERMRGRQAWTAARLTARLNDRIGRGRELMEVHALFDPTYHSLPEPVRRFYRLISLIPQFDVRRAARLVGADQQEVEPMLDELLDRYLVAEPSPGRFALHPLVRDHALALLLDTESEDDLLAAVGRVRLGGRAELELVGLKDPRVA